MSQISFKKYSRSSFFAKPANCDTLFRRTSTMRLAPDARRISKNFRADFLVNPIVNSVIPLLRRRKIRLDLCTPPSSIGLRKHQPVAHPGCAGGLQRDLPDVEGAPQPRVASQVGQF